VPSLAALSKIGVDISLVLTQPNRRAGRGRQLRLSAVKRHADSRHLQLAQPKALIDPKQLAEFGDSPDALIVVAYGLLLPQWLLDWPRVACINVHASLLPRWRGAAPIQHAILAGDQQTGISIMQMERGLDSGPVYATRSIRLGPDHTAASLHDALAELGADLLCDVLPSILDGELTAAEQDSSLATYADKISKADARLDWSQSAELLERRVRAFNPWPVAEASLSDGRRLRIWAAQSLNETCAAMPGTIVAVQPAGIDVATGDGVLRLSKLQPPSSTVMDAAAYLAAHDLEGVAFAC